MHTVGIASHRESARHGEYDIHYVHPARHVLLGEVTRLLFDEIREKWHHFSLIKILLCIPVQPHLTRVAPSSAALHALNINMWLY